MTIKRHPTENRRISLSEILKMGISASENSDLSAFGIPRVEEVERPEPQPEHRVVAGPDEEYEPGKWRQTWVQEEIPEPPVPQVVSRAQGKTVLISQGLWAGVQAWIAAIEDDTQRALAEVAVNDTQEWRRDSPTMIAAASALGITEEQMDELFIAASQVEL